LGWLLDLPYFSFFFSICFVVGIVKVFLFLWKVLNVYVLYNFTGSKLSKFKDSGSWAVVTGASDGIGRSFAEQLSEKGFNIVLLSRTKANLEEVAKNLKTETKIIPINFSTATEKDYNNVRKNLEGLDIGVLVNNVGVSHDYAERFHQISEESLNNLLNINIMATTSMTRIVLPIMKKQKRGLVLNISTSASLFPHPMLSVYSASKAYVNTLSIALAYEYKKYNVHVECLTPYLIKTKLSKIQTANNERPLPDKYVREALKKVGNKYIHSGYAPHEKFIFQVSLLPNFLKIPQTFSRLLAARKKIKSREKEKK